VESGCVWKWPWEAAVPSSCGNRLCPVVVAVAVAVETGCVWKWPWEVVAVAVAGCGNWLCLAVALTVAYGAAS
jgi:hypothetical protein